jgi:putative flippase GtrA
MASLLSRVHAFRRTEHFGRLWKYAAGSVVTTCISQVVLFLTYHVWTVGTAMECNVIATAVASGPAYYLNRKWAWGKSGRSDMWREVVPFWVLAFLGLVLSTAAVGITAHNADRIASGSLDRALLVNGANLFTYACIWTGRYFLFNRFMFGHRAGKGASVPAHQAVGEPALVTVPVTGQTADLESGVLQSVAREGVDQGH